MKKLLLLLAFNLLFITAFQVKAQKDNRTISTRIADVLAQLPAKNETDLNTAMKEMEGLGEAGLMQLPQQMVPGSKADNSKLEYAIMGYTAYVSAKGREALKRSAESAWCKSAPLLRDKKQVSFLLSMLDIIGTDQAVECVTSYLDDDALSLKAIATLASIGTAKAGDELTSSLSSSSTPKNAVLQALGEMRFAGGLKAIAGFISSNDVKTKEAALYALSQIADPSSAEILLNETSGAGAIYGNKDATARYASYITNLNANGQTKLADDLANAFYRNSINSSVFAKTAALGSVVKLEKGKAIKLLVKATTDNDIEYRNEALKLAAPFLNNETAELYLRELKNASAEVQADIIRFLGNNKMQMASRSISKYARKSKNAAVKNAAILAMAQIGGRKVAAELLDILKKGKDEEAIAVKQGLLLVSDPGLSGLIISRIQQFDGVKKAALLDVLGEKQAEEGFAIVAAATSSADSDVKKSALEALPKVSSAASLPPLFLMLQTFSNEAEIGVIQKSISAGLDEMKNNVEKEDLVLTKMKESPQDKQFLYFPLLSAIGSQKMLDVVYNAFKTSTGNSKQQAFSALNSWPNSNAMEVLYAIASTGTEVQNKDAALGGFIGLIRKVKVPQEQKLLLLKKAMQAAGTAAQKNRILSETAGITTFPALAFAAGYLDDEVTKQKAADAVMNIGLNNKSFHGTLVRQWLTKAINSLGGADAVYAQKSIQKFLDDMTDKEGFVELFNAKDLTGWKGLVGNPITRSKMSEKELADAQVKADSAMRNGWIVENGALLFKGKGDNIATIKNYGDIEMQLDWKIFDDNNKYGDAGIYLRGTPQVQMWDTSRVKVGAQVGSGGLYNNQKNVSKPLKVADNKLGEWNHFYIKMIGEKVTVYLNGELVTDNVPLENYWNKNMPIFPEEQIELQAHGSRVAYRDIYIKELPRTEIFKLSDEEKNAGYKVLFDGTNMGEWIGNVTDYVIEDGKMVIRPKPGSRGNLYSKDEYSNFNFRFEFKLTAGANNGLGIRAPLEGDAAYTGMELQILDNEADVYKSLHEYQYHGSVYGVIPAKRGFLKPVGEWNTEEVIVKGPKVKVILNGTAISDGDLTDARKNGTLDKKSHPGILRDKGHFGFLGHGSVVYFRNIRVKEL
ncbi:MAG: DUF1080 domain-containing protein [Chitinophagaceae bacterium]|nr:DUF1080 domain-containing protein [Chitinophagaceae bacterium]